VQLTLHGFLLCAAPHLSGPVATRSPAKESYNLQRTCGVPNPPGPLANKRVAHVSLLRHGERRPSTCNLLPQTASTPQNPGLKRETWATRHPTQPTRRVKRNGPVQPSTCNLLPLARVPGTSASVTRCNGAGTGFWGSEKSGFGSGMRAVWLLAMSFFSSGHSSSKYPMKRRRAGKGPGDPPSLKSYNEPVASYLPWYRILSQVHDQPGKSEAGM
jgi:hypothetical protein